MPLFQLATNCEALAGTVWLMSAQSQTFMFQTVAPGRVALVLPTAEGRPWTLTMSSGVERFVGRYARLNRLLIDGPLLDLRTEHPGS